MDLLTFLNAWFLFRFWLRLHVLLAPDDEYHFTHHPCQLMLCFINLWLRRNTTLKKHRTKTKISSLWMRQCINNLEAISLKINLKLMICQQKQKTECPKATKKDSNARRSNKRLKTELDVCLKQTQWEGNHFHSWIVKNGLWCQ